MPVLHPGGAQVPDRPPGGQSRAADDLHAVPPAQDAAPLLLLASVVGGPSVGPDLGLMQWLQHVAVVYLLIIWLHGCLVDWFVDKFVGLLIFSFQSLFISF